MSQLGDGYPGDKRLEDELFQRLEGNFIRYSDFLGEYNDGRKIVNFDHRMTCLRGFISAMGTDDVVMFGRSAGLRAATRLAHEGCPNLRAIVGFCYPFRHPKKAHEPDRVEHLAGLTTPTLIIQGDRDRYGGGADVPTLYTLSKAIELHVISTDHSFSVSPAQWDWITGQVTAFLERHCRREDAPTPGPADARSLSAAIGKWVQRLRLSPKRDGR
ncbi:alpha/beta family hydrolase [Xanthobacter sediminis]